MNQCKRGYIVFRFKLLRYLLYRYPDGSCKYEERKKMHVCPVLGISHSANIVIYYRSLVGRKRKELFKIFYPKPLHGEVVYMYLIGIH